MSLHELYMVLAPFVLVSSANSVESINFFSLDINIFIHIKYVIYERSTNIYVNIYIYIIWNRKSFVSCTILRIKLRSLQVLVKVDEFILVLEVVL